MKSSWGVSPPPHTDTNTENSKKNASTLLHTCQLVVFTHISISFESVEIQCNHVFSLQLLQTAFNRGALHKDTETGFTVCRFNAVLREPYTAPRLRALYCWTPSQAQSGLWVRIPDPRSLWEPQRLWNRNMFDPLTLISNKKVYK